MERTDYAVLLPRQPSEKVLRWARRVSGVEREHLLLYCKKTVREPLTGERQEMAWLSCSACGGQSMAPSIPAGGCGSAYLTAPFGWLHPMTHKAVIHGEKSRCPLCGAAVRVEYMRNSQSGAWERKSGCFLSVERVGACLALVGWLLKGEAVREKGGHLREELRVLPYQAYVFERRKAVYLRGYTKCFSQIRFQGEWTQMRRCMDEWGPLGTHGIAPWDKRLLHGSSCENSKLKEYLQAAGNEALPVSYLRLWQKKPNAENLVVQGAGALLHELISYEAVRCYGDWYAGIPKIEDIAWNETRPAKMLHLTREEFRHCVAEQWDRKSWKFYLDCAARGERLKLPQELECCRKAGIDGIVEAARRAGSSAAAIARYLARQGVGATLLQDYWIMAEREGYDLAQRQTKFPKDLRHAHDRVLREREERHERERDEKKRAENERLRETFRSIAQALEWMSMERGGISIRICRAPEELDAEGKALHHCVATYKQKHARGESAIFFLRETKAPDTPWYTLELALTGEDAPRVLQNRGKCNCERTERVTQFEREWLLFVRKQWAQQKKKNKRRMAG